MRLILFSLALGLATGAMAATVEPQSLGQLVALSERVFVGTVTAQAARLEGGRVVTDTRFAVEHALKGDKSPTFALTQAGGTVGEQTTHVPGYPRFAVGERVLLFVERADTGALVVAGMAQGKFSLAPDPKTGALIATRDVSDLHFVHGRNAPDRTFAGTPAGVDRVALAQVAALIDGGARPRPYIPTVVRARTPQRSILGAEGVPGADPNAGEVTP